MSDTFPSPTLPVSSRAEVFLRYLDYFRGRIVAKVEGLDELEQRRSRLPSGWTPLELLKHLTFVELRWLEWGFEGHPVDEPWGDQRDGRWYVAPAETAEDLLSALRAQAARSRAIIEINDLAAVGQPGPRWYGDEPATLERVLFHLLQEYARHLGHLDIVAELADGPIGGVATGLPAQGSSIGHAGAPFLTVATGQELSRVARRAVVVSPRC